VSAGRLFRVLQKIGEQRPPAAIGVVTALAGPRLYRVSLQGVEYEVPAVGDATAQVGQAVAVVMDAVSGQPLGMLGVVKP
jgi:hypothetical protein